MPTVHVMPNAVGGWDVTEGQSPARLGQFARQADAVAYGRLRIQPTGSALLIHRKILILPPQARRSVLLAD